MARTPTGPLAGSVAIVTGAAGDIGQAIAVALIRSGVSVALADIDTVDAPIHTTDDEVDAGFSAVSSHRVDVTDAQSCEELIGHVKSTYGRDDIVVNNAGINVRKLLVDTTEEEWLHIQDVNVNGAFRMCRAMYAHSEPDGTRPLSTLHRLPGSLVSLQPRHMASPRRV